MPEPTTRTPTEIFEAVLENYVPSAYVDGLRDEFQRALVYLGEPASAEEAFGMGSGTSVVGWGPPGEELPVPPGGIVPGAYRVESVTTGEGPDGPTLDMELVLDGDPAHGGPLGVLPPGQPVKPPRVGPGDHLFRPADEGESGDGYGLLEALKASFAQDRRFRGGELAGDD